MSGVSAATVHELRGQPVSPPPPSGEAGAHQGAVAAAAATAAGSGRRARRPAWATLAAKNSGPDGAFAGREQAGQARFVETCRRTRTILPATTTIERLCADALVRRGTPDRSAYHGAAAGGRAEVVCFQPFGNGPATRPCYARSNDDSERAAQPHRS